MKKLIIFLFGLLLSSPAWAVYPSYTVCTSGCDFTTLEAAITDISTNHATPANPVTITISGSWSSADTSAVNITGITTSSTNTLTILTTGAAANNGKLPTGTGGYRLAVASGTGISINCHWVTIQGLAIDQSGTASGDAVFVTNFFSNLNFIGNVMKGSSGGGQGLNWQAPRGTNNAYNNVFYNFTNGNGIKMPAGAGDGTTVVNIDNNTFYNNFFGATLGEAAGAQFKVNNNVFSNSSSKDISNTITVFSGSNNICGDSSSCTTAPLTSGTNNATSYSTYYTSTASGDFSLLAGSLLIGAGTSLSSLFTTDILGSTRTTWDVGAFFFSQSTATIYAGGGSIYGKINTN